MAGCSLMLLTHDPSTAATQLAAGVLSCPSQGCSGRLGPWGHARQRVLRLGSGQSEAHTPRRARCRRCGGTHVIVPATAGSPSWSSCRRPPCAGGSVGPGPTARRSGAHATVAVHALDPEAAPLPPTGTALGDMLDAVDRALAAAARFGPVPAPWQLAVVINGGAILALRPRPAWHGSG